MHAQDCSRHEVILVDARCSHGGAIALNAPENIADGPHTVRVVVKDQYGRSDEITWEVTVSAACQGQEGANECANGTTCVEAGKGGLCWAPEDGAGCGCRSTGNGQASLWALLLVAFLLRRQRRSTTWR